MFNSLRSRASFPQADKPEPVNIPVCEFLKFFVRYPVERINFPLVFLVFFPDGTVAASWDGPISNDLSDEVIDLRPGGLGASRIHLQARTEDYNAESYNLFNPQNVTQGDEGPQEPLSPYTTLSLEDSNSEVFGRTITLNNLSGRVVIKNYKPVDLDQLFVDFGYHYY